MEPEILKYRLKRNYNSILKDLEPKKLVGYLYQEGVFDEDEMDEVRDERTRKKQAIQLLSMLSRKPTEEWFDVLVNALQETQPHLARLLQTPVEGETRRNVPGNVPANCSSGYKEIMGMMQTLHCSPSGNETMNVPAETIWYDSYMGDSGSNTHFPTTPEENGTTFVNPTKLDFISRLYRPNELESVYKMTSSPRGIAVVINVNNFDSVSTPTGEELVNREGSIVDEKALVDLFTALDFETRKLADLTKDELMAALEKMSKSDFSGYDCFVLCVMSHGKDGFFYAKDGGQITIKAVLQKFNNANCKTLCGKPKLYFIQACRGKLSDNGTIVKDGPSGTPTEHDEPLKQPEKPQYSFNLKLPKGPTTGEYADQFVAFSSVEGFSSYRNTRSGSRFIRSLVDVFRYYASMEDVESMMTRVIKSVNSQGDLGSKQVPKPETTLTRKVFFWPGMKFE